MERLTKKDTKVYEGIEYVLCNHTDEECNDWCMYKKCVWIENALKKLKAYEDAEEQGKLIRFPCKVGEDVWCLEEYEDGFDYSGYIFLAMCGEYCITTAHYMHLETLEEQLEEMVDDCENWGHTELNIIHKSRVFLTREEAEQALAKMKEGVMDEILQ